MARKFFSIELRERHEAEDIAFRDGINRVLKHYQADHPGMGKLEALYRLVGEGAAQQGGGAAGADGQSAELAGRGRVTRRNEQSGTDAADERVSELETAFPQDFRS